MQEVWSVSELTFAIKKFLEPRFSFLCIKGEVINLKEQSSGHLYFTLKDETAQISAVLFKGHARLLSRHPKNGDQVIVKGELTIYPPRGNYQILVKELQYSGVGELLVKFHDLKQKLQLKGWFDKEKKKSLPKFPKTIGVVTSPTGAVIQDIIHILKRRFSGFQLLLNPVKVQGEGAAEEIATAIYQFNQFKLADVLIVGRGGGSLEDLWPFNEEVVAAAIFASEIPIISAVGHETDFCISDFVADVRAPTPSAAAELAMVQKSDHIEFLSQMHQRLKQTAGHLIAQNRQQLKSFQNHPLLSSPLTFMSKYFQLLDGVKEDLDHHMTVYLNQKKMHLLALQKQAQALRPSMQIKNFKEKLSYFERSLLAVLKQQWQNRYERFQEDDFQRKLQKKILELIYEKKQRLNALISHLKSIDPRNLLTKGYCILFSEKKDSVILSSQELSIDQKLCILLNDGEAKATINAIKHEQSLL